MNMAISHFYYILELKNRIDSFLDLEYYLNSYLKILCCLFYLKFKKNPL